MKAFISTLSKLNYSAQSLVRLALAAGLILTAIVGLARWSAGTASAGGDLIVGINGAACSYVSVNQAVAAANPGDTIYLSAGTYYETLGTLHISLNFMGATSNCTVPDPTGTPSDYVLDGSSIYAPQGGLVRIGAGENVAFTNMTLQNGLADNGGIVYVDGGATLTLTRVYIQDGVATSNGGNIYVANQGVLNANGNTFIKDGIAAEAGGGLYLAGQGYFYAADIRGNQAPKGGGVAMTGSSYLSLDFADVGVGTAPNNATDGGGVYMIDQAHLELNSGADVMWNNASGDGGGIYAVGSVVIDVAGGRIYGNAADSGFGGGIYATSNAQVNLSQSGQVGHSNPANGNSAIRGGGLYVAGISALTISDNVIVQNNSAGDNGGGIYLTGSTPLTTNGGTILDNVAGVNGGGIANQDGAVTLNGGTVISGNQAMFGGGVAQWNSAANEFTANDSQIISNTATVEGGGIYSTVGAIAITDSSGQAQLSGNSAATNGGAVYAAGGDVVWLQTTTADGLLTVSGNSAGQNGGAFYIQNGTVLFLVDNVWVNGNTAQVDGGGIYQNGGDLVIIGIPEGGLTLHQPQVNGNTATTGRGGGIYVTNVSSGAGSPGSLVMNATIGGNNAATQGGGLYVKGGSFVRLFNSHVATNQASQGAGLMLSAARVEVDLYGEGGCHNAFLAADQYCSEFRGNIASGNGGAVRMELDADFILNNSAVIDNSAGAGLGGAIYSSTNGDHLEITNSLIAGNSGKAVYTVADVELEVAQSTFVDNDWAIDVNDNGAAVDMQNTIVWSNGFGVESAAAISGGCSIVQNGVGGAASDPLFQTTGRGAYRLAAGSPAIDACAVGTPTDMDEVPRPAGSNFDMGAFETGRPLVMVTPFIQVAEGDSGTTPVEIVVSLSEASTTSVNVNVTGVSGQATSGIDFAPLSTTLVFNPGTISQTVSLNVFGDTIYEGDENLALQFSGTGAALVFTSTQVVILDNEALPSLSILPVAAPEGNAGLTPFVFTVSLSHLSAYTTTVDFSTSDDTALAGLDYQSVSGTLTILPGQSSGTITVWVIGDDLTEADETFDLSLFNPQGGVIPGEGNSVAGTIEDDDGSFMVYLPVVRRP